MKRWEKICHNFSNFLFGNATRQLHTFILKFPDLYVSGKYCKVFIVKMWNLKIQSRLYSTNTKPNTQGLLCFYRCQPQQCWEPFSREKFWQQWWCLESPTWSGKCFLDEDIRSRLWRVRRESIHSIYYQDRKPLSSLM